VGSNPTPAACRPGLDRAQRDRHGETDHDEQARPHPFHLEASGKSVSATIASRAPAANAWMSAPVRPGRVERSSNETEPIRTARPEGHHNPDHLPTRRENVRNDRAQEQR
jgi:hypothetical protein